MWIIHFKRILLQLLAWAMLIALPWQLARSQDVQSYQDSLLFSQFKTSRALKDWDPLKSVAFGQSLDLSDPLYRAELKRNEDFIFSNQNKLPPPPADLSTSCSSAWKDGLKEAASGQKYIFTYPDYAAANQRACQSFQNKPEDNLCCLKGFYAGAHEIIRRAIAAPGPSVCYLEYLLGMDEARANCETAQCRIRNPGQKLFHPTCYAHGFLLGSAEYAANPSCAANRSLWGLLERISDRPEAPKKDRATDASGKDLKSGVGQ